MFEGKPLSKMTYADLEAYLREGNEEGTRLDYKEEAVSDVPKICCAFANTAGGHLILGVREERGPKGEKTKRPDPDNVPGLTARDWEASLMGKIRDRTRPPVVPEVKALQIPGRTEMVVVVRVEESVDAPHEVHVSSGPEIPVRRGDDTKSAGVDDVERLIYRRDRLRGGGMQPLWPQHFGTRLRTDPSSVARETPQPPSVAVAIRPRRVASLRFDFDAALDEKLKQLGVTNRLLDGSGGYRASSSGVALEMPAGGTPRSRVEVLRSGAILAAEALKPRRSKPRIDDSAGGSGLRPEVATHRFDDVAELPLNAVHFAARAYATVGPAVEMEVLLDFSECHGHVLELRASEGHRAYSGTVPEAPAGGRTLYPLTVRTDGQGEPLEDDLVGLLRDASRAFGVSAPDEVLRRFL